MLGHLRSLALALCLYQTSAFAGVISTGGAIRNSANVQANAATLPPRVIDGVVEQQQLGEDGYFCCCPCLLAPPFLCSAGQSHLSVLVLGHEILGF